MRNIAEIPLKTNIGFVTLDLYANDCRNRTENEHRVCNLRFVFEIVEKWNENEHRVCNIGFVCEIPQKSHETRT